MEIKNFSMDYYDEVYELWKKTGLTVTKSDSREGVKIMLERNPDLFLIGIENDKLVSVVYGGFDGRRGFVHHLAVDPDFQRKGLGKMMMEELVKRFKRMNVEKIHLFIEKRNLGVIEFYKRLGWYLRDDLVMMSFVPEEELEKEKE
ncbi:MAG: GNAT family N-acetyltransferase [Candidatus Heimdallarchaeaceae archaeon]